MSSLPPEMITSVLIRLPVKSLLRFRCVSKSWCAEIDGPDFIKLHLNHSIATGSNHSHTAQYEGSLYFLDSDSLTNLVKIKTPLRYPSQTISTCNGLLLLEWEYLTLFIVNPFTRKYSVLPTPPPGSKYAIGASVSNCLGYDVVNDDYKVFNIYLLADEADNFIAYEARVYSLNSNDWHIVKDFAKGIEFDDAPFVAYYIHGALHTINGNDHKSIVALDVGKEVCNLIPMPDFEDKKVLFSMAHVFDGCLAVVCDYPDRIDIWVMREYGVKESWSMLLSVKPNNRYSVMPMVYSKSRTEVLLSFYFDKLMWYDLRKKTVRDFQVNGLPKQPNRFGLIVCVESLVSVSKHRGRTKLISEIHNRRGDRMAGRVFLSI